MNTALAFLIVIGSLIAITLLLRVALDLLWKGTVRAHEIQMERLNRSERPPAPPIPTEEETVDPNDENFQRWMAAAQYDNHERLDTPCLGCQEKPAPRRSLPNV